LADTAWELFHRCTREEADMYLKKRASQGFNVIQAVALAELDCLNTPNPYGEIPLIDSDPKNPNEKYFEHVDYIIKKAAELGFYVALLIIGIQKDTLAYVSAIRDRNGSYAMIYLLHGGSKYLDLTSLSKDKLSTWWFDPRTGNSYAGEKLKNSDRVKIEAPTNGKGHDWVLVIDSKAYNIPGKADYTKQ